MVPVVEVSDSTYQTLQSLAEPFVDKSPEDVIIKLIHHYKGAATTVAPKATSEQSAPRESGPREYGQGVLPNLLFSKVLSAELNGTELPKANWNRLLDETILEAAAKLKDVKKLKEILVVNAVEGRKEDQGYRYLKAAGVSVQGQDASGAWKGASHIIKAMGFAARVVFEWYDNPKAANPGKTGKFTLNIE
jgi:hypothetical protein